MRAKPLALKFSMNTSERSASRMRSSRPSGRRLSMVQESLFRRDALFMAWRFQGRSGRSGTGGSVERPEETRVREGGAGLVSLGRRRQDPWVLHPDDLGAEVGEQHGGERTRPHRGQIEDPDPDGAVERSATARCRRPAPPACSCARPPGDRVPPQLGVVLPEARGEPADRPSALGETIRGSGQLDCPAPGSSAWTQNPRWARCSASMTSLGEFTPASGHPTRCASAVASARVRDKSHG